MSKKFGDKIMELDSGGSVINGAYSVSFLINFNFNFVYFLHSHLSCMKYKPRALAGDGRVTFYIKPYFAGGFDSKVIASFMRVMSSMLFLDCLHNK